MDSTAGNNSCEILPSEMWFDRENGETNLFGVSWGTNFANEEDSECNMGYPYGPSIEQGTMVHWGSPFLPLPVQILTEFR